MDRPTKEIILPKSGAKVTLFSYLVNGDYEKMEELAAGFIKLDFAEINKAETDEEKDKLRKEQVRRLMQDNEFQIRKSGEKLILRLSIKSIELKDGETWEPVADIEAFLYNLQRPDYLLIEEEVNKIDADSTMTEEQKKN